MLTTVTVKVNAQNQPQRTIEVLNTPLKVILLIQLVVTVHKHIQNTPTILLLQHGVTASPISHHLYNWGYSTCMLAPGEMF